MRFAALPNLFYMTFKVNPVEGNILLSFCASRSSSENSAEHKDSLECTL